MADRLDFGGAEITSEGDDDVIVFALGPDGSERWAWSFGSPGQDRGGVIRLGPDGVLRVSGSFAQTVDGTTHSSAGE